MLLEVTLTVHKLQELGSSISRLMSSKTGNNRTLLCMERYECKKEWKKTGMEFRLSIMYYIFHRWECGSGMSSSQTLVIKECLKRENKDPSRSISTFFVTMSKSYSYHIKHIMQEGRKEVE